MDIYVLYVLAADPNTRTSQPGAFCTRYEGRAAMYETWSPARESDTVVHIIVHANLSRPNCNPAWNWSVSYVCGTADPGRIQSVIQTLNASVEVIRVFTVQWTFAFYRVQFDATRRCQGCRRRQHCGVLLAA